MSIKCSYCKSPISKDEKNCPWCGSKDPVDLISHFANKENIIVNVQQNKSTESQTEILNLKSLNIFFQSIKDIDRNYKSSLNTGLLSKVMSKLEGVDYSKNKSKLISSFSKDLDDRGILLLINFVESEMDKYEKAISANKNTFFNPKSNTFLIDKGILTSWRLLLNKYVTTSENEEVKSKIQTTINNMN